MKTKRAFLAISIVALIFAIAILVWREAYFVMIALLAGTLLIGHRQLWSLIKRRKLPPADERMRENINKSLRNAFIFFAAASAFMMLFFYWFTGLFSNMTPNIAYVLGSLFLSGGTVYLLSYLFFDRAEPKLNEKHLRMLKIFLLVAGISLPVFIISSVLHNALSALFGAEEPVFFCISVFISPLALVVGLIGSLVIFVKGLFIRLP